MKNGMISIIVPVLNENDINQLLADVKSKTEPGSIQIIVVDADSTQSTLNLITDPTAIKLTSPKGRGVQQNRGAREAIGDVLLFLHADTTLPNNFQSLILETIEAGFAGGAFDLKIDDPHPLLRFISKTATLRSRLTGIPYGDQAIFLTRSLFNEVGGFPELPLMEDIALMKKVKKTKAPFCFLKERVTTSARMWRKKGIIYTMIRNPILALLYHLGVPPRILVRFYYG